MISLNTFKNIKTNKLLFIFSFLILLSCKSKSQQNEAVVTTIVDKTQITWNKDINDVLAQAKQSGKMIFVECYSPTCPVCISMEPFFKKPEVATKYNSNFINYKLDVGIAEQVKFLGDRNIWLPSFPQFLFFDSDGKLVHQADVVADVSSMTKAADMALNTEKRSGSYAERFKKGERSVDFLMNYAAYCRLTKDTLNNTSAADELFKIYPQDQVGTETGWKITKKCVSDLDNGFAKYWFDHVPVAKAFESKDGHDGNENNILGQMVQYSLFSPKAKTFSVAKINLIKSYMGRIGAGQYADVSAWEAELNALIRENKLEAAIGVGDKISKKFLTNGQSLIYITKVFNDLFPNASYAPKAKIWMATAKPLLKGDTLQSQYYYENARFNLKMGDKVAAKADATMARTLAVKSQQDITQINALLNSIN